MLCVVGREHPHSLLATLFPDFPDLAIPAELRPQQLGSSGEQVFGGSPRHHRCSTQRRPSVRRNGKVGVCHRNSHRVNGVPRLTQRSGHRIACWRIGGRGHLFDRPLLLTAYACSPATEGIGSSSRGIASIEMTWLFGSAPGTRYGCWFTLITTPFTPRYLLQGEGDLGGKQAALGIRQSEYRLT